MIIEENKLFYAILDLEGSPAIRGIKLPEPLEFEEWYCEGCYIPAESIFEHANSGFYPYKKVTYKLMLAVDPHDIHEVWFCTTLKRAKEIVISILQDRINEIRRLKVKDLQVSVHKRY